MWRGGFAFLEEWPRRASLRLHFWDILSSPDLLPPPTNKDNTCPSDFRDLSSTPGYLLSSESCTLIPSQQSLVLGP